MPLYNVLFTHAGAGKTGLSPTCNVHYADDSNITNPTVTELDATNQPGVYQVSFSPVKHCTAVWTAGTALVGDPGIQLHEYGPAVPERDEGITPAVEGSTLAADVWTSTNHHNGNGATVGEAVASILNALTTSDDTSYAADKTTTAAANKFYGTLMQPGVARNAEYAGRLALHRSATSLSTLVKITSIASDGGGDYFNFTALSGASVSVVTGDAFVVLSRTETTADVWDALAANHSSTGSMGLLLRLVAGLAFNNMRLKDIVRSGGGQLSTANLVVYPTANDATLDTSPLLTLPVTGTYDGDGRLTGFIVTGTT